MGEEQVRLLRPLAAPKQPNRLEQLPSHHVASALNFQLGSPTGRGPVCLLISSGLASNKGSRVNSVTTMSFHASKLLHLYVAKLASQPGLAKTVRQRLAAM